MHNSHTTLNESFNTALTHAQNLSKRAGVAWSLINDEKYLLVCEASIAGLEKDKLARAVRKYKNALEHLFISIEPTSGVFEISDLIESIEQSNCNQITIGCQLQDLCGDENWRTWGKNWQGTINYLSSNTVAKRLGLGIEKIKCHQRPWVIAVSAANFTGVSLPLKKFVNEFGFQDYLTRLVQQNRAILYATSQHDIIENLPESTVMDEPIELFEIFSTDNIAPILRYCASEYRCSVVLLCDMPLLAFLVSTHQVDEIVHHIGNFDGAIHTSNEQEHHMLTESFLGLNDWILLSSAAVGKCNRMVLCNQLPTTDLNLELGRGSN